MKTMTVDEFWRLGWIQEINRRLLHPVGLALQVELDAAGKAVKFTDVLDAREDPEGFVFTAEMLADGDMLDKKQAVEKELDSRLEARLAALGYTIQPVEE